MSMLRVFNATDSRNVQGGSKQQLYSKNSMATMKWPALAQVESAIDTLVIGKREVL